MTDRDLFSAVLNAIGGLAYKLTGKVMVVDVLTGENRDEVRRIILDPLNVTWEDPKHWNVDSMESDSTVLQPGSTRHANGPSVPQHPVSSEA